MNGREIQDDWRFTKVYVRGSDKWQVVAWHASESAPRCKLRVCRERHERPLC